MTRPTLVIGLGGTGHWVLTYLKKELLEIGKGVVPSSVRLLGIDTAMGEITVTGGSVKDGNSSDTGLADVKLTDNIEFLQIGCDLYGLVKNINEEIKNVRLEDKDRQYKHLYWYPADELLKKLLQPAFNSVHGAGAIRQMGRLSLFNKITEVRNMIQSKIAELQALVQYDDDRQVYNSLEVLIVGSFAGGTGAGTLIDVAYLTKSIIKELHIPRCQVRGFIVMPSAFHGMALNADPEKLTRSYAAWTELDRFMLITSDNGKPPEIDYSPRNNIKVICDDPPFDLTYIVDSNRVPLPLQPPPQEGLFPAVAQAMMFIVDQKSGPVFSQDLINTIAGLRSTLPVGVYHSAIGTFTIKVPAYFEQAKASRKLSKSILEMWLEPNLDSNGMVLSIGSQIKEKLPDAGLMSSQDFLTSSSQVGLDGNQYGNTMEFPKIASVHAAYHAQTMDDLITQTAKAKLSNDKSPWMTAFVTTSGTSDEDKKLALEIREEIYSSIWKANPPCTEKGDTPATSITRLTNGTENFILSKYGKEDDEGKRKGGTVRDVFSKVKEYQFKRFKILLGVWIKRTLIGTDPDVIKARSGKLGYVQQTVEELEHAFSTFESFITKVQAQRDSEGYVAKAKTNSTAKAMSFRNNANKTSVFATVFTGKNISPDALQAERDYLTAQQNLCEVLRDEELLLANIQTSMLCREYLKATREEINRWVEVLVSGRNGVEGLYQRLLGSMKGMDDRLDLDKRLGNPDFEKNQTFTKVLQLIGNRAPIQVTEEQCRTSLSNFNWDIQEGRDGLLLNLSITTPPQNDDERETIVPFVKTISDKTESDQTGSEYNLAQLLLHTDKPYWAIAYHNKITDDLRKIAPDGALLARMLHGIAEPFYARDENATNPKDRSAFIQIDSTLEPDYINKFQIGIENLTRAQNIRINIAGSEDPYRFTYVRCDDLIPSDSFQIRSTLKKEYDKEVLSRVRTYKELHIFPSIQNTLFYEQKVPELLKVATSKFHPEISGLLEDPWHFDLWFFAQAAGFITEDIEVGGKSTWKYKVNGGEEINLYQSLESVGVASSRSDEDYFSAIRGFLSGRDYRSTRRDVNAYNIDWVKLNEEFLQWESKNLKETMKVYENEKDGLGVVISRILSEVNTVPQYSKDKYFQLALAGRVVFADRYARIKK